MSTPPSYDVVIPTLGRPSLQRVLAAVLFGRGPLPAHVVVVDDRPPGTPHLDVPGARSSLVLVLRSYGAGPAAARNVGWRAGDAEWVAFLDDDVEPPHGWRAALAADLAAVDADAGVVGSQGALTVPLPANRRPTDRERDVAGLAGARWITADLAYRRTALEAVGGFDERFRRAYREDSDLALQLAARGGRIVRGARSVVHPVGGAPWWVSVARQRGNHDDALMRHRYGRSWRHAAHAFPTRFPAHVATTFAGAVAAVAAVSGRRRIAVAFGAAWAAATLHYATARARPGPRRAAELAALAVTSALIPPVAVWQRLRGELRILGDSRLGLPAAHRSGPNARPRAVLFDRDGTLVHDVPYNGDPAQVVVVDEAREAITELRAAGLSVAVITNQSGVARGLLTLEQVDAVNRRIDAELGPVDRWLVCPHGPDDRCRCRKPAPGLVVAAAAHLRVAPASCVVIGDTEADVAAARAVGARGILVANAATRATEVACAPESAPTLRAAVQRVLAS